MSILRRSKLFLLGLVVGISISAVVAIISAIYLAFMLLIYPIVRFGHSDNAHIKPFLRIFYVIGESIFWGLLIAPILIIVTGGAFLASAITGIFGYDIFDQLRNRWSGLMEFDEHDLERLANCSENSMRALTASEKKIYKVIETKYGSILAEKGGKEAVISQIKAELVERYKKSPATYQIIKSWWEYTPETLLTLTQDFSNEISLPLNFEDFEGAGFSPAQFQQAVKGYYIHPVHTAYRLLSNPNPWIHPEASYVLVNGNDESLRAADIRPDIKKMLALVWLAASDPNPDTFVNGMNPKGRKDFIISSLALINRAHNWEQTRPKLDNEQGYLFMEEYDDGEADKPSCGPGIKRRIFESLIGHSILLNALTREKLNLEIGEYVRGHFKKCFNEKEYESLKEISSGLNEAFINLSEVPDCVKDTNLTDDEVKQLKQEIEKKYNISIDKYKDLQAFFSKKFEVKEDGSHISQFYLEYSIKDILGNILESKKINQNNGTDIHILDYNKSQLNLH